MVSSVRPPGGAPRSELERAATEPIRCAACGSSRSAHLFVSRGYPLRECGACGLRFLSPQPDDATLASIYTADYFLGERNEEAEARVRKLKSATAGLYLDDLASRLGISGGRLHEVGCGQGDLLMEAKARGFTVSGVELSPHAASVANGRLGATRVAVGELGASAVPSNGYDVIIGVDVIEHVRDPLDFLRRLHRMLKPGGTALLVTAALDSWSARILGRHWMEYKIEHLFYFNAQAVRRALRRCGFSEITVAPSGKVLSFDYLHLHFQRFPVPVMTPIIGLARSMMPARLAHRHLKLGGSGMVVSARRAPAIRSSANAVADHSA